MSNNLIKIKLTYYFNMQPELEILNSNVEKLEQISDIKHQIKQNEIYNRFCNYGKQPYWESFIVIRENSNNIEKTIQELYKKLYESVNLSKESFLKSIDNIPNINKNDIHYKLQSLMYYNKNAFFVNKNAFYDELFNEIILSSKKNVPLFDKEKFDNFLNNHNITKEFFSFENIIKTIKSIDIEGNIIIFKNKKSYNEIKQNIIYLLQKQVIMSFYDSKKKFSYNPINVIQIDELKGNINNE